MSLTWDDARRLALALPGSEEHPHHGAASFKARKIFAVLRRPGTITLGLGVEDQENLLQVHPDLLTPVTGRGGSSGWTFLDLARCDEETAAMLIRLAWSVAGPAKPKKAKR